MCVCLCVCSLVRVGVCVSVCVRACLRAKMLYEHVDKADFEKAIRMCRFVKEQPLWACLAAMSIYCRELNTVEIALAAIDEADKV